MIQAPIRLIAIDVDGTLLDSSHRVPSAVGDALAGLHRRGVEIVLASARSPQLMETVLAQLSFVPLLVCFSGAWIGDVCSQSAKRQPIFERPLILSAAQKVISVALSRGLEPNVFYPFEWRVRRFTPEAETESYITGAIPLVTSELLENERGPGKILIIGEPGEDAGALRSVADAIRSFATATFSKSNYLEVIAPGINKAASLAILAQKLGLELSTIAAIGDGLNDMEMIEASGFGIAMGNAAPEVKSVADWITLSHDQAGVSEAVQELLRRRLV